MVYFRRMNYVLMILSFVGGVLQINKLRVQNAKLKPWLIFVVLVLIFVFSALAQYSKDQDDEYGSNVGVIESKPRNGVIYPTLRIGNAKIELREKSGYFFDGTDTAGMFGDAKLRMWIYNNQLHISTTIRDYSRNAVAVITDNEWEVNNQDFFKKNFTKNTFEIVDNEGNVYLQVDMLDSATVRLNALYYYKKPCVSFVKEGDSTIKRTIYGLSIFGMPDGSGVFLPFYDSTEHKLPVQEQKVLTLNSKHDKGR